MLRENLKTVIAKSGLIVKEIAAKSGVNKRTIDKWVGIKATEPKVNDLYEVCKALETTVEYLLTGKHPEGIDPEILEIARKITALSPQDREEIMLVINHKLGR